MLITSDKIMTLSLLDVLIRSSPVILHTSRNTTNMNVEQKWQYTGFVSDTLNYYGTGRVFFESSIMKEQSSQV